MVIDRFGPEYVVRVADSAVGMEGFLVIDNTALGPGKGGIRMTPDVTEEEVARLARTMTWKTALAGLPFGGAKAGIRWSGGSDEDKKRVLQSFAKAIALFTPKKYIAGPDVNTGEREMQWFVETTGNWRSATGKPATLCMSLFGKRGEKCGIPHEFGSTGFGVAQAARIAADVLGLAINRATVAVEGFGNVGSFTFQYLSDMGAKIVAIADKEGAVYDPRGLDGKVLQSLRTAGTSVTAYAGGKHLSHDEIFGLPADILVPAAVTDVIHAGNKDIIQAKIIVEGANIPMREEIEEELFRKGVLIVPDFVANAGGVISSYAEYRGYNPKQMMKLVERKVGTMVRTVLTASVKQHKHPRMVALELARARVEAAMRGRKLKEPPALE